ncbi:MAG: ATP-binding protein, partial [Candidatus Woesearchaeota archaeon]
MRLLGITGGKGGTGKSTIATALAWQLSKSMRVLLVDADVDCPNDHLILDIKRKELKTIKQRIPKFDLGKCTRCRSCGKACRTNAIIAIRDNNPIFLPNQCNGCGACKIVCLSNAISWDSKEIGKLFSGKKGNIDLILGELKTNQPISEFIVRQLNEEIEKRKDNYDYIIIDTAAGTHCPVITALEKTDSVIAITEPTPLGAHDLEIVLKLLSKLGKTGSIITNKSDIGDKKIIEAIAKKYGLQILFEIPYSKEIINSYSSGKPIQITSILS